MICFTCSGTGNVPVHGYGDTIYGDESSKTCGRCHGLGEIPNEARQWIDDGKILFHKRVELKCPIQEASRQTDVDVLTLSEMENGIVEPDVNIYNDLVCPYVHLAGHSR